MRFRSLRALPRFAVVAVALHVPATVQAHEWASDFDNVRVIQIADGGDSDGSSNDGSSASESNSDSSDSDAGSDDSDGDQQSNSEAHGGNRSDDKFDGPNGALKAVQADRALPLGDIVAIARHLTDGQIIDTRLRPVKGILQYELKVLETNNEVRRYSFNARTGKLIRVR